MLWQLSIYRRGLIKVISFLNIYCTYGMDKTMFNDLSNFLLLQVYWLTIFPTTLK